VSVPRFFAPDASASALIELSRDEAHHLKHVLRLGPGAPVAVFDGQGREWAGRVASVGRRGATLARLEAATPVAEPSVRVTLAIGLLKSDQMDTVVRDATMLGVSAVQPVISARVAVARRASGATGVPRWQRVALASVKQCRRAVVPSIRPPAALPAVLDEVRSGGRSDVAAPATLMFVEPGVGAPATPLCGSDWPDGPPASALVLIGPEGGWSADEVDLAVRAGARLFHLGPRTLRAESAPVVALSAIWTTWGWS
jgi:16S rRNA (uracil1498-N3)-methyltransferase